MAHGKGSAGVFYLIPINNRGNESIIPISLIVNLKKITNQLIDGFVTEWMLTRMTPMRNLLS